ncbi:MAG TPA: hypothetical protein PLT66_03305 [Bacillota bacterium]|nr:hypothetical protein [Bacillota bacterium]
MKRITALLLSLLLLLSLAACGGGGGGGSSGGTGGSEIPPEGYDAEYTIYVNGAEEWTPFAGKSGVSFTVSDDKAISVSDNGSKIEFTGKQVGESVITATLDGTESKALVRVRAMAGGDKDDEEKAAVPLIRELPNSFYIEYTAAGYENTVSICLTESSYCTKYFDADAARYGWNKDYYTPSVRYDYWEGYGWMDMTDDVGWTSGKFNSWLTDDDDPIFYEILCAFRMVIAERGDKAINDISQYSTGKSETIANVKCEIYEIGPYSYWVEPTYHFCLKSVNSGNVEFAVTKYEAPFAGENILAPQSDEVIHSASNG